MAEATVKTVQFLDPRIEPQPDPVYDYVIGPTQNQYYKIPASGKSNSSINFNNLTTLGADRAYLDTFELEIQATFTFNLNQAVQAGDEIGRQLLRGLTFDSFPFNKCCSEARVNINGGSFFSQPMCYVRAKEHYMSQEKLQKCYANVCPVIRPYTQYEGSRGFDANDRAITQANIPEIFGYNSAVEDYTAYPTRLPIGSAGWAQTPNNMLSGTNNSIITFGNTSANPPGFANYHFAQDAAGTWTKLQLVVTWREPVFCSPFSSRYDSDFGRPLYNITSMDLAFTMQSLGNMIRYLPTYLTTGGGAAAAVPIHVESYDVDLNSVQLCYQVMTIPSMLNKPLTTLVPYRRFVPYITDNAQNLNGTVGARAVPITGSVDPIEINSGVYTLNEIPTAIWLFVAPVKARYQTNDADRQVNPANGAIIPPAVDDQKTFPAWDSNKQFGFIEKVEISLANTTQILSTATPYDLYRIAKANGCDDSFESWGRRYTPDFTFSDQNTVVGLLNISFPKNKTCYGTGSVLRLRPGVDLIVPDQPLIPGANAKNMVFQAKVYAHTAPCSYAQRDYALWLIFEYVGVAAISPGQCEISMNPLGDGQVMAVSPIVSATSEATEGEMEGSGGFWSKARRALKIANAAAKDLKNMWGVIKPMLPPGAVEKMGKWLQNKMGGEEPPAPKRARGGAVMARGYKDWI